MERTTRSWIVLVAAHVWAASVATLALKIFLTPLDHIQVVAAQPVRYAIYALAIFAVANAAGTVLAVFLTRTSWLPLLYLWSVPFGIVLYPAIDPAAANFVYVGVTSHVGGALALIASISWVLGLGAGAWLVLHFGAERIPS